MYKGIIEKHTKKSEEVKKQLNLQNLSPSGDVEAIFEKAISHLIVGELDSAISPLCAFFEKNMNTRQWQPYDEVVINLLIDLCVNTEHIDKLQHVFFSYYKSSLRESSSPAEKAVTYLVNLLDDLLKEAQVNNTPSEKITDDKANENLNKQKKHLQIKTIAENLSKCSDDVWLSFCSSTVSDKLNPVNVVMKSINVILNMKGPQRPFGVQAISCFLHALKEFLSIVAKYKLNRVVYNIATKYKDFCDALFTDFDNPYISDDYRIKALRNHQSQIINTNYTLIEVGLHVGNWGTVSLCISHIYSLIRNMERTAAVVNRRKLENQEKISLVFDNTIGERRFKVIASVFLHIKNWLFHAFLMHEYSKFKNEALTMAVVATLCVSRSADENAKHSSLIVDEDNVTSSQIADLLKISLPTRTSLFNSVLKIVDLGKKIKMPVFELFNNVLNGNISNLDTLYHLLNQIATIPSIEPYIEALERSMLEEYFTNYFSNNSILKFSDFENIKKCFKSSNDVYDIAINRGATIDLQKNEAHYNTSALKLKEAIADLSLYFKKALDLGIPKRKKIIIKHEDIMEEEEYILNRMKLHQSRNQKNTERNISLVDRQREEAKKRREEKEQKERKKQQEARRKHQELLRVKVREAEEYERRKKVVKILNDKYKISISEAIARKKDNEFIDEMSEIITEHKKKSDSAKSIDIRNANYLEMLIRENDMKAREIKDSKLAQQLVEEKKTRIENFLIQHRADYEAKAAQKRRFDEFRVQAERYEAEKREKFLASVKLSKRDKENEGIEQYKAELAAKASMASD